MLDLYAKNPQWVQPDFRMNEVSSFVEGGLKDISISRKTIKWGIPWPDDPNTFSTSGTTRSPATYRRAHSAYGEGDGRFPRPKAGSTPQRFEERAGFSPETAHSMLARPTST